jgi:hypothetical protein
MSNTKKSNNKQWLDYEQLIHKKLSILYPQTKISHNATLPGKISKKNRQIDILIEGVIAGFDMKIVIDCKCYSKNVDIKDVETFLGLLNDVGANKGVIITTKGYSSGALDRAENDSLDVDLKIFTLEELIRFEPYQTLLALPFRHNIPVLILAPSGWLIDGRSNKNWLASLYCMGSTLDDSIAKNNFMYVKISVKNNEIKNLNDLLIMQKIHLEKHSNGTAIEMLPIYTRKDGKTIQVRKIINGYSEIEYTGFIETGKIIFFVVLHTNKNKEKIDFKKFKFLLDNSLFIDSLEINVIGKFNDINYKAILLGDGTIEIFRENMVTAICRIRSGSDLSKEYFTEQEANFINNFIKPLILHIN